MTHNSIEELLLAAGSSGYEGFWEYDGAFFMLFYDRFRNVPAAGIPDLPFLYMEISSWRGMSARGGVWQYYESRAFEKGKFERVLSLLKRNGEEEMAAVYGWGIHNYADETYQEDYNYPGEWLDEAEKIDKWIRDKEGYIYQWMYKLLLAHKSELLELGQN